MTESVDGLPLSQLLERVNERLGAVLDKVTMESEGKLMAEEHVALDGAATEFFDVCQVLERELSWITCAWREPDSSAESVEREIQCLRKDQQRKTQVLRDERAKVGQWLTELESLSAAQREAMSLPVSASGLASGQRMGARASPAPLAAEQPPSTTGSTTAPVTSVSGTLG